MKQHHRNTLPWKLVGIITGIPSALTQSYHQEQRFLNRSLSIQSTIRSLPVLLLIAVLLIDLSPVIAAQSGKPNMAQIHCGNIIYQGNKSSVCFADKFLADAGKNTTLDVAREFYPVKLEGDSLFETPFCIFSGEKSFSLSQKERENLKKYLLHGGFILASPSCSDENWDKAFRRELKLCFPDRDLVRIPMSHPLFSVVHKITRLTTKNGKPTLVEGLEIDGRLVLIYSKDGLNDVANAKGCCCCGGNQINECVQVNVNVLTYSLLY